ncbi:MAG: hypothetical protein PHX08_19160 [Lachnospiraceae bacterium]|nr:hypothetical protein [Lachnospiraceae bacterium]
MKKVSIAAISGILGALAGGVGANYFADKQLIKIEKKVDKFKNYYSMLNQWLLLKQDGKSLADYFADKGIKTIAIYGMGEMGNRLYDELKQTEIKVMYGIDKEASSVYSELEVIECEEISEGVDAIVVTAVFAFEEISEELKHKVSFPIISLEEVVYSI